jgi:adenosylmethionine-8-amino-7-oxononanoate aminotransferase
MRATKCRSLADLAERHHLGESIMAIRAFKQSPRLFALAKDLHYFSPKGRAMIGGSAGLWCANAGHCRALIVEAVRAQATSSRQPRGG